MKCRPLNGRSRLAIPGMLLPSPIRPFYPISLPLKTLQQNRENCLHLDSRPMARHCMPQNATHQIAMMALRSAVPANGGFGPERVSRVPSAAMAASSASTASTKASTSENASHEAGDVVAGVKAVPTCGWSDGCWRRPQTYPTALPRVSPHSPQSSIPISTGRHARSVAVGTEVTSRPPRRSRRAAFPHRAPAEGQTRPAFGAWAAHPVPVRGLRPSGTCRFRLCVRGMRWPLPFLRPAAFPPRSPPPTRRPVLFEASSGTMQPSDSSDLPVRLRLLAFPNRPGTARAVAGGRRSPRFRHDP